MWIREGREGEVFESGYLVVVEVQLAEAREGLQVLDFVQLVVAHHQFLSRPQPLVSQPAQTRCKARARVGAHLKNGQVVEVLQTLEAAVGQVQLLRRPSET